MRGTGIVRRMDDLGRVVIPKEIRRTMNLKELDEMEISIQNENEIVARKFVPGNVGNIRNIDELGRVVIPKEIRRRLSINESDPLEFFIQNNNEIVLKKYEPLQQNDKCVFCENDKDNELIPFKEKYVCQKCLESLAKRR